MGRLRSDRPKTRILIPRAGLAVEKPKKIDYPIKYFGATFLTPLDPFCPWWDGPILRNVVGARGRGLGFLV